MVENLSLLYLMLIWSDGRVTILNVTWQCHTVYVSDHITLKFVVELGYLVL